MGHESSLCPTPHLNFLPIPPFAGGRFTRLLEDFRSLRSPYTSTPVRHDVSHIVIKGRPVFARPRRLSPKKLVASKAEFNKPHSPKRNGEWRPYGDYRRLRNGITSDLFPIPYIKDIASNLAGKTIFKIDLVRRAYYKIPVTVDGIAKTVVITINLLV